MRENFFLSFDNAKIRPIFLPPYHFLRFSIQFVTTYILYCDKLWKSTRNLSQTCLCIKDFDEDACFYKILGDVFFQVVLLAIIE